MTTAKLDKNARYQVLALRWSFPVLSATRVASFSHRASHARQPGVSRRTPVRCRRQSPLSPPCDAACRCARPASPSSCAASPRGTGVSASSQPDPSSVGPSPGVTGVAESANASLAAWELFRLSLSPAAPKTSFEASMTDSTSIRFVGLRAKAWRLTKRQRGGRRRSATTVRAQWSAEHYFIRAWRRAASFCVFRDGVKWYTVGLRSGLYPVRRAPRILPLSRARKASKTKTAAETRWD